MSTQNHTTSFVYFITTDFEHVKIGVTGDIVGRLRKLQTAHYQEVHLLFTVECQSREHALEIEKGLHSFYSKCRIRSEWFKISRLELSHHIRLLALLSGGTTFRRHSNDGLLYGAPYIDIRDLMHEPTTRLNVPPPTNEDEAQQVIDTARRRIAEGE